MEYDAATALIVVDVQNDFADPGGSLYVRGGETIIGFIDGQIEEAANAGAVVVYTQDWHPASTSHFEKDGGIWPVHCVAGTVGAELHPDLDVLDDAIRVRKGVGGEDGYSAFTVRDPVSGAEQRTGLHDILRESAVDRVAVLGLALDYCVKETALDAARLGYTTHLIADGTLPVNLAAGDGARSVVALVAAGVNVE